MPTPPSGYENYKISHISIKFYIYISTYTPSDILKVIGNSGVYSQTAILFDSSNVPRSFNPVYGVGGINDAPPILFDSQSLNIFDTTLIKLLIKFQ